MDVARLNFSHGDHAEHQSRYDWVREAATAASRPVGILADLQGPKIRLGRFADGPVEWADGETVVITSDDDASGDHDRVSCTYGGLPAEVRPGDRLLIDDGKVAVEVVEVVDGRHHLPGRRGRRGLQQQGRVAAQRRGERAGSVRKGR